MSLTRQLLAHQLAEPDRRALLARARGLRVAVDRAAGALPLEGRHIAVARAPASAAGADLVAAAATALGAHVSRIGRLELHRSDDPDGLARMLGSLYDAVDCGELDAGRALELHERAGVPVFDGLAEANHPLRALVDQMDDDTPPGTTTASREAHLAALVQAVLLATVT